MTTPCLNTPKTSLTHSICQSFDTGHVDYVANVFGNLDSVLVGVDVFKHDNQGPSIGVCTEGMFGDNAYQGNTLTAWLQ